VCTGDTALDVLPARGHVGFPSLEVFVRLLVGGPPNGGNDDLPFGYARAVRVHHDADCFVAQDLIRFVFGNAAVRPSDDLVIGSVDSDPQGSDEHGAVLWLRPRNVEQPRP
jgi:hypothetical protein